MLRSWLVRSTRAGQRLCRKLHIRHSTAKDLAKLEKKVDLTSIFILLCLYAVIFLSCCVLCNSQASHISLGVGFIAAYAPNATSSVWVQPFDCSPNLFGELGAWHHLRVPTADDAPIISKVACGRSHVVALTTEGKGTPSTI